jgi:hypothetical protein
MQGNRKFSDKDIHARKEVSSSSLYPETGYAFRFIVVFLTSSRKLLGIAFYQNSPLKIFLPFEIQDYIYFTLGKAL